MVFLSRSKVIIAQCIKLLAVTCTRVANYSSPANPYNLSAAKRGTGGKCSFNGICVTVFGATGYVGRYLCNRLGKYGTQIVIPYRSAFSDVMRLKICGDLGQILFMPYYIRNKDDLAKAVKYSNVVVNLVGRDWETKNFKFDDVHVIAAREIAKAAKKAGVKRFIHLSALNGSPNPTPFVQSKGSQFLASKYRGEIAVLKEFPEATIFRPADVYGHEDRFLRYYAHIWRRQNKSIPLWKKGECTIKQPVYVGNLVSGIVNSIYDPETAGKVYQAVGPERYYLSDLVDWFYKIMRKDESWGYRRRDIRWNIRFKLKISFTEAVCWSFPVGNLHWERIERECITDKVHRNLPTLEDLGVELTPMEERVNWELKPFTYAIYHERHLDGFEVRPPPPTPIK